MADTTLDQLVTYIQNLITTNMGALGLRSVTFADEGLTKDYPSCVIIPGDLTRMPEASGRVTANHFTVLVFVLHAEMSVTRSVRQHHDLQMAEAVTALLHQNFTMGGLVAGGWVANERARQLPFRKAHNILSTELTWTGTARGLIF